MQPSERPIGVMLVDDHQTMLWGLSRLIDGESPRMQVVGTARNCEDALEQAGQIQPDVILLDLDLNGTSALGILPGLTSNSDSRVLILTGERQQKTLDLAVLGGARGVLRKDASAEHVLRAIERAHNGELCLDNETMARVFTEFVEQQVGLFRVDPVLHGNVRPPWLKVLRAKPRLKAASQGSANIVELVGGDREGDATAEVVYAGRCHGRRHDVCCQGGEC